MPHCFTSWKTKNQFSLFFTYKFLHFNFSLLNVLNLILTLIYSSSFKIIHLAILYKFWYIYCTNILTSPKWFWAHFIIFCLLVFSRLVTKQGKTLSNFSHRRVLRPPQRKSFKDISRKRKNTVFSLILSLSLRWNFSLCNKSKRVSWTWFLALHFQLNQVSFICHPLLAIEVGLAHLCISNSWLAWVLD